jgi:Putative amidoligase enzyme
MPRRYDYTAGAYRLTCMTPGCTSEVVTHHDGRGDTTGDIDIRTGRDVHETFASRGERGGNQGRCRTCVREASRARRANGPRVPGTSGSVVTDRRFGVELELIFPHHVDRSDITNALHAEGLTTWRVKSDTSLSGGRGWEVVSPVLQGDDGREQIRVACRVLRALGAKPNRSCGMHVHHEIRELTIGQVKSVAKAWFTRQALTDGLVSESRRGSHFCQRHTPSEQTDIERMRDLRSLQRIGSRRPYSYRFRSFNLVSYGRYGTVEIRQHQGTCDAEKIISWVSYGQAIIAAAATSGELAPATTMRDHLASLGEHLNETARTFLLGRAVEFNYVTV